MLNRYHAECLRASAKRDLTNPWHDSPANSYSYEFFSFDPWHT